MGGGEDGLLGVRFGDLLARKDPGLRKLVARLARLRNGRSGPPALAVGIDGLPGSGKSALAARLEKVFAARGARLLRFSLDDLYYSAEERRRLGLTRWGPGAHDLSLGRKLAELKRLPRGGVLDLPLFDKRVRDRSPQPRRVEGPLDFILFEGFGCGWARDGYEDISRQLDFLVFLKTPAELCRVRRREAGWEDRAAHFGHDRAAYDRDFELMWATIEEQAERVLASSEARADLVLSP